MLSDASTWESSSRSENLLKLEYYHESCCMFSKDEVKHKLRPHVYSFSFQLFLFSYGNSPSFEFADLITWQYLNEAVEFKKQQTFAELAYIHAGFMQDFFSGKRIGFDDR